MYTYVYIWYILQYNSSLITGNTIQHYAELHNVIEAIHRVLLVAARRQQMEWSASQLMLPFCLLKWRSCNFMRQFRMLITQKVNRHLGFPLYYIILHIFYYFYLRFIWFFSRSPFLCFFFFYYYYYYGVWSELFNWRWIYALARSYYICASVNSSRGEGKKGYCCGCLRSISHHPRGGGPMGCHI